MKKSAPGCNGLEPEQKVHLKEPMPSIIEKIDVTVQTGAKANPASKWILVISGQEVIRDLLERFFQIDGHFVSTAAFGSEGLDKATKLPVDLIVLDNDLAASSALRGRFKAEAATSHLPVLWVGSRLSKNDSRPAAIADTDCMLTLPFSYSQMREASNRLLGLAS